MSLIYNHLRIISNTYTNKYVKYVILLLIMLMSYNIAFAQHKALNNTNGVKKGFITRDIVLTIGFWPKINF